MTESSAPEVVEETVTATQSSNHQSAPPTEQKRVKLTTVSLVASVTSSYPITTCTTNL